MKDLDRIRQLAGLAEADIAPAPTAPTAPTTPTGAQAPGEAGKTDVTADPAFKKYAEIRALYDLINKEVNDPNTDIGIIKNVSPNMDKVIQDIMTRAKQLAGSKASDFEKAYLGSEEAMLAKGAENLKDLKNQL